jgi:hypothetical protein
MANLGSVLIGAAMLINALVAVYGLMLSHKNAANIKTLEVNTNSKFSDLLKITGESEHAKGVLQGQKEG